jgi:hypothetical protein
VPFKEEHADVDDVANNVVVGQQGSECDGKVVREMWEPYSSHTAAALQQHNTAAQKSKHCTIKEFL